MLNLTRWIQIVMAATVVSLMGGVVIQHSQLDAQLAQIRALQNRVTQLTAEKASEERARQRSLAGNKQIYNELLAARAELEQLRKALKPGVDDGLKRLPADDFHKSVNW